MRKKITILAMALLSFVFVASAQTHVFKVISSKGQTEIKRGSKWLPVNRGTKVYEGSRLRIKESGYLGLIHKSGKPIQLKKQGEYDVNTLASKINVRSAGFASKYGSYIANKMSGSSTSRTSAHMLGAVERDLEGITILVQKKSSIRKTPTVVKWETKQAGPYIITVTNLFDEPILQTESATNQVEINLTGKEVEGDICIVKVQSKTNPEAKSERSFEIISGSKETEVNTALSEIERELDLNNALDNFFYATYFEDKNLYLEALHYYEQAMKMEPDVEDYKKAYEEFLQRQGLEK